jgi:hypothetical protein
LTSIDLPSTLVSIGGEAFSECSALTNIHLPNSLTTIGNEAFYYCESLSSIDLPDNLTTIGAWTFYWCSSLTDIDLPQSLVSIGNGAFRKCSAITEIDLPAGIASIESRAFHGCASLAQATFRGDAPLLGEDAFDSAAPDFKILYPTGKSGWSTPEWHGYPAHPYDDTLSPADQWLEDHGLPAGTPLDQDLNGDGVDLLMAWALNLDPHENLAGSLPEAVLSPSELSMSFYGANPHIRYSVQTSLDAKTWTPQGVTLSEPDANGFRTASVPRDAPRRFLRLLVEEE